MAILIDTQALVWVGLGSDRLSSTARAAIDHVGAALFVSAVTAYEFVELNARGRFGQDLPFAEIEAMLGFEVLDFPGLCGAIAGLLPPIHRDPVDRMLVAHAIHADLAIVTADTAIHAYPVRTLW